MNSTYKYILSLLLVFLPLLAKAQEPVIVTDANGEVHTEYVAEFELFFKVGDPSFYIDYSTNRQSLDSLDRFMRRFSLAHIAKFEVVTYSSPEGTLELNEQLAKGRSESALKYLVARYPVLSNFDSAAIGGEAWDDLARVVEADETLTPVQKNQALTLITSPAFPIPMKKQRLANLPFYNYMLNKLYPMVRHSALRLISYEAFVPIIEDEEVEIADENIALGSDHIAVSQLAAPVQPEPVRDTVLTAVQPELLAAKDSIRTKDDVRVKDTARTKDDVRVKTTSKTASKSKPERVKDAKDAAHAKDNARVKDTSKTASKAKPDRVKDAKDAARAKDAKRAKDSDKNTNDAKTVREYTFAPEPDYLQVRDTLPEQYAKTEPERVKSTIMSLNTNLLYDLVTALNFEVEVPFAGRFSLMVEDVFPWWETGNKYCFQMWEIGAEVRFWLKGWDKVSTEKMRGFFVGPYVMSSKYDFQNDKKFNYQGEYWSAGATAGYAIALGKKKKVNLDLSLSFGMLQSDYRHYNPGNSYEFLIKDPYNIGKYSWFGPTKLKIALCIPINTWKDRK